MKDKIRQSTIRIKGLQLCNSIDANIRIFRPMLKSALNYFLLINITDQ